MPQITPPYRAINEMQELVHSLSPGIEGVAIENKERVEAKKLAQKYRAPTEHQQQKWASNILIEYWKTYSEMRYP